MNAVKTKKTSLKNQILKMYNEFITENGKPPNILRIPRRHSKEFEKIVEKFQYNLRPDIFGETKHRWYMGMRVFSEIWSFGVEWSVETEKIKQRVYK